MVFLIRPSSATTLHMYTNNSNTSLTIPNVKTNITCREGTTERTFVNGNIVLMNYYGTNSNNGLEYVLDILLDKTITDIYIMFE